MPVGFGVLPGSTSDSTTLPDVYNSVHKIADEGAIEFLMAESTLPQATYDF